MTIAAGTQVRYHGSVTQLHGAYRVAGTCPCDGCDTDRVVWDIVARNHRAAPGTFPAPGPEPVRYVLEPTIAGKGRVLNLEHVRAESFTVAGEAGA